MMHSVWFSKTMKTKINVRYPTVTAGSRHARELRTRGNALSEKDRQGLAKSAVHRLYNGSPKP